MKFCPKRASFFLKNSLLNGLMLRNIVSQNSVKISNVFFQIIVQPNGGYFFKQKYYFWGVVFSKNVLHI